MYILFDTVDKLYWTKLVQNFWSFICNSLNYFMISDRTAKLHTQVSIAVAHLIPYVSQIS